MIFFSVQKFLKGNLKASFVVKVFLMGITILDRRILFVKFWLWRALKVESRPSDLPPRYVLRLNLLQIFRGLEQGWAISKAGMAPELLRVNPAISDPGPGIF